MLYLHKEVGNGCGKQIQVEEAQVLWAMSIFGLLRTQPVQCRLLVRKVSTIYSMLLVRKASTVYSTLHTLPLCSPSTL